MIVTIARETGSGGEEIAREVARLLEAPLIDQEAITRASGLAGVTEASLSDPAHLQAAAEQVAARVIQYPRPPELSHANPGVANVPSFDSRLFRRFIEAVLGRVAVSRRTVVILGYAAQITLRDDPQAVHVLICAPVPMRIANLTRRDEFSRENVAQVLRESDHARAEFFKRHFNVDWRNPELYHLIINTEQIPQEAAPALIVEAAQRILAPV